MLFGKTQTARLDIEGMTCGHCVQTVTEALRSVPAVKRAHVDLDTKTATIETKGAPDLGRLSAAVAAAGYQARPR